MEFKEKLVTGISIAAFCISVFSTVSGQMNSTDERKRTVRSQLTDVLGKLSILQLDAIKLQREAKGDDQHLQQIKEVLGQQNGFLIDQAVFLSDQIPSLTTTYELNTIALANANAGNFLVAEKYYKRAAEIAPTNLYKSMALRSYAAFLYPQARIQEGRQLFRQAIDTLKGEDNLVRFTNGLTYQLWAVQELNFAHSMEKAKEYFETARREYSTIDAELTRKNALASLDSVRSQFGLPQDPNPGLQAQ